MPARNPRIPFRSAEKVPPALALIHQDDKQAPEIQKGDEVAFVDEVPASGDLALIVMRPEIVPDGVAQCLVMRLGADVPPHVTFPWRERADTKVRMLLVVSQANPARQLALRCDQVLALRKFSHVQKRPLPVAPEA